MNTNIRNFYEGKTVLLTGTTGFVGKVILEKFLRSLPHLKQILVLMRKKKGNSITQRFINQTISSPLFEVLKKKLGQDFEPYIQQKIRLIEGDLLLPNLGMSEEDRIYCEENCNMVLNCAASIDFNAKLKDALQINVLGSLQMYNLARSCKNLENFIHISTTYVNSDKLGFIEEDIYKTSADPDATLKRLLDLPEKQLEQQTPQILGKYPNTYTYTKALVERIMQKNVPSDMTVTIIRPSIVGSTWKEPFKGWVENISASTAVFTFVGLGIVHQITSQDHVIGDITPVDYVANYCAVAGAMYANGNKLTVCNAGTSAINPMYWEYARKMVELYWQNSPAEKAAGKCHISFYKTPERTRLVNQFSLVPIKGYQKVVEAVGTPKLKKDAARVLKIANRASTVQEIFAHFSGNEWIFDSKNAVHLLSLISPEEREFFWLDASEIDWKDYLIYYQWGIQKFILNETVPRPISSELLLKSRQTYFSDIQWSLEKGKYFKTRSQSQYKSMVLNSQKVLHEINLLVEWRTKEAQGQVKTHKQISIEKIKERCKQDAIMLANQMIANYSMSVLRMLAWGFHKVFRTIYEKVIIDDTILKSLQNYDEKTQGPIVFIPTHRSYVDFMIVSYILFAYKLQAPHIAAAEDFLKMAIVPHFLRMAGAFFLRRKLEPELQPLYKAMLNEYVTRLLMDSCCLEFFIEGTRSRNFKTLPPKFGILSTVVDAVHEEKIKNAMILPLTINYEKVLEEDTYPYELMGEEKVKESTMRMLKASKTIAMNYGKIFIEFCEPISVKKYLTDNSHLEKKQIINQLGYDITYALQEKIVVTIPTVVASILLMHRKGIMEHILVSKVEWLIEKIQQRGVSVGSIATKSEQSGVSQAVRQACILLENNLIKSKKTVFEMSVAPNMDFKTILMLHYYRNGLHHIFIQEAILCISLGYFGQQKAQKGVKIEKYWRETQFLLELLKKEHVSKRQINNYDQFLDFLRVMCDYKVLKYDEQEQLVSIQDDRMFNFLCSQVWSTVESYWTTCVYFFTLKKNENHYVKEFQLPQYVQWFAESMYDENALEYSESCSLDMLKNAVSNFIDLGVIKVNNDTNIKGQGYINTNISDEELSKLEQHISKFFKRNYVSNMNTSPIDLAKRTVLGEYNPKL